MSGPGLVDVHCHILPGLDDGSESLEESLEMAAAAARAGFSVVIATPHVMQGVFEATADKIRSAVAELQAKCDEAGLGLTVLPGSEVYLDEGIVDLADAGRLVTLGALNAGGGGRHLLLELPADEAGYYVRQVLFDLSVKGYKPVIAHPERNSRLREDESLVGDLAGSGAVFQLNAGSLLGYYGTRARRAAERWLAEGRYTFVGSDWHSSMEPNSLIEIVKKDGIARLLEANRSVLEKADHA